MTKRFAFYTRGRRLQLHHLAGRRIRSRGRLENKRRRVCVLSEWCQPDTESTGQLIHRTGRRRTSFDDDDAECSPQSAGTDGDSRFRESPVPVQFGSSEAQFGFEDPITLSRSTHSFLFTERADSVPFFFGVAICLILVMLNNILGGDPDNPFELPGM